MGFLEREIRGWLNAGTGVATCVWSWRKLRSELHQVRKYSEGPKTIDVMRILSGRYIGESNVW